MFFIVVRQKKGPLPKRDIDDVETFLIQTAKQKNQLVENDKKTKKIPDWRIAGVTRSGKGKASLASRAFKNMIGL